MADASKPPKHTELPIEQVIATRPRRGLLAAIGVIAAAVLVLGVVVATTDDDDGDGSAASVDDQVVDKRWSVIGASGDVGGQEVPDVALDGTIAIDFGPDGRLSFTGCNGGSGDMEIDGDHLMVDEMVSTAMACADADGEILMDWDRWFARFLEGGVDMAVDGEALTLAGDDAVVDLELEGPVPDDPPVEDPDASVSSDSSPDSDSSSDSGSSPDSGSVDSDESPSDSPSSDPVLPDPGDAPPAEPDR